MPLNKLENFIKNTDGRTLYVNPNDLNATDSITNQGTSLTEPFRTIQRALIESARFSYVRGENNDLIERTTILVYPGEHPIDNRPGYGIRTVNNNPVAVTPSGELVDPFLAFNITSDSNFDIESPNNVLYRYNSIYGGVVVPRGTSIVGMDLRKTKIRPLYVPNPTDPEAPDSAIFRITGTCYFWQFTIFDGREDGVVFTDPRDFSENNQSTPSFSHHKLTAFEYADGVNPAIANGFELTDLQMYYSKLSNAYNEASGRPIDEKYPSDPDGFAPQRPEFEIVGAFATDPIRITRLISGDGVTPEAPVTVDTATPHELSVGTPIKIRGVAVDDYNISTKVTTIQSPTRFKYSLSFVRPNLPAEPSVSSATVTVETDTVTGASPYIFNVSMRSVWGINGMHADGSKATGFRSMVVAQFTAISLQKDDRAFVKYNNQARRYDGINYKTVKGAELSAQASSTNTATVYHLDPEAIYRPDWGTTHIKMTNDAVIQIVSVFAIGFNQHFFAGSGADASITNSNSNFGQFSLLANGFKNNAFSKDDKGFITHLITPRSPFNPESDQVEIVDWTNIDFEATNSIAIPSQLYLKGFKNREDTPPGVTQGFKIGARYDELLFQPTSDTAVTPSATPKMPNVRIGPGNNLASGDSVGRKVYSVLSGPVNSTLTLPAHGLLNGEKVRIFSSIGDLPENVARATLYYANVLDSENIRLSTSEANAFNNVFVQIYGGTDLRVESRVNDKNPGDAGHPLQYDEINSQWFLFTEGNSGIYQYVKNNPTSNDGNDFISQFERKSDNRSLDDKLYRVRYVIPKEALNAKPPTPGYIVQSSSTTGALTSDDFEKTTLKIDDYEYDRNPRYIVNCKVAGNNKEVEVRTEKPHSLNIGDKILITNVESTDNPSAFQGRGYDGEFLVTNIDDARNFRYSLTDVNNFTRTPGNFSNDTNDRNILLPRFSRKDGQINAFVYRIDVIVDFEEGIRDGVYHLYLVNGGNKVDETFTSRAYNQPIEDLYPQLDLDNLRPNPPSSTTFANRAPLGRTTIDEQQNSITRETIDRVMSARNLNIVKSTSDGAPEIDGSFETTIQFEREHVFNKLFGFTTLRGGSGYTDGTFYNVKLLSNFGTNWKGATAEVTIISGAITDLTIMDNGSGYQNNETISIDPTDIGGGTGAEIDLTAKDVSDNINTIIQTTGAGGNYKDSYVYLTDVVDEVTIGVARTTGSAPIVAGMYAYPCDSATGIVTYSYDPIEQLSTFTASPNTGFGLNRGQTFVVYNNERAQVGQFFVSEITSPNVMSAITQRDLQADGTTVALLGKTGLEDNDASTGPQGENIQTRGSTFFDLGTLYIKQDTSSNTSLRFRPAEDVAGVANKLRLGQYIQVGSEIMRIASSSATGSQQDTLQVIRGAFGSNITNHPTNSKVRTIDPLAIELRRSSILRASGHTFEYIGYGPGNYSTALPQLQVKQLPDNEVYLVQAQELSCGQVVYTGMSDNGDFYIGNIKYSATSGTQTTFDIPIPTIAGQLASSNSVVFDEVIINRRLFVGGGETKEILSQFDGPVKFTNSVVIQDRLSVSDVASIFEIEVNSLKPSTSPTNGALHVRGGTGIEGDLNVGGELNVGGDVDFESNVSIGLTLTVAEDIIGGKDLIIAGDGIFSGDVILTNPDDGEVVTNLVRATDGDKVMKLWWNQGLGEIEVGKTGDSKTIFNVTKPGSGEGGEDDIDNSDGGVDIKGSLVVREKCIAKEFIGDGLGKPGSIIMWGGNSTNVPKGYILCNGATLNKNSYSKLFKAIGYQWGGTGDNFNIPDLRDRFIVGATSSYTVGQKGGSNTVVLTEAQIPGHLHAINNDTHVHNHNAGTTIANGNATHSHNAGSAGAGSHSHSGNSNSGGRHAHSLLMNSAGSHSHRGETEGGGAHNHEYNNNTGRTEAGGGDQGGASNRANTRNDGDHRHNITTNNDGGHSHSGNTSTQSDHSHGINIGNNNNHSHNINVASNAATHAHGANTNIGNDTHTHNHTSNSTGGGASHENRPPFFALCYIMQFK